MEVTKKTDGGISIFEINGKLDVTGSQIAQEAIVSDIPQNGKLIIDMKDCDYVASSGLRVLVIAAKQSALNSCKTVLAGVQPLVWEVIVMTGFDDVLETYPTQAEAIEALK